MKKTIVMLLLASMLLSLAACGGADKDKETETGTDTADTTAQGESETETETTDPLAGLDVIDMEGFPAAHPQQRPLGSGHGGG